MIHSVIVDFEENVVVEFDDVTISLPAEEAKYLAKTIEDLLC